MDPSKPHGGSKTPVILLIVSLLLTLVFIAAVILFFIFFNKSPAHNITVTNSSTTNVTVIFGAMIGPDTIAYLPNHTIAPGGSYTYQSTPGTSLIIQGSLSSSEAARTTVYLNLAGEAFASETIITDGQTKITGLTRNELNEDNYGVSVQQGYNIPVTIVGSNSSASCPGPLWTQNVICPTALQATGSCLSACQAIGGTDYCCEFQNACQLPGGCESVWLQPDYYHTYGAACPNCLITNCDTNNYFCASKGELTSYTITFE